MMEENKNIDKLISESIRDFDISKISSDFTERLSKKFELRLYIKTLLREWCAKLILIILILSCITGLYYYYSPKTFSNILNNINFIFILFVIIILMVVFLIDQVFLKILFRKYDKKN